MVDFKRLVIDKIEELGTKESAKFFGVSSGTISNWLNGNTSPSIEAVQLVYADAEPPTAEDHDGLLTEWNGRECILLLPVYRTFNADTHFTLFANYAKYGPEKLGMIQEKRTVIHEARNILAHKARKAKPKYVIMVDDDMILPCGNPSLFNGRYGAGVSVTSAGYNAISRLMSHGPDKEIVGALYFGRHEHGKAQCAKGFTSQVENKALRDGIYSGLITDEWVGTGCIRIAMTAFEKMAAEIDNGRWPECKPKGLDGWYGFFTPIQTRVGEDVSFGRRAKEIGIQTYVDAGLVCLHAGERLYGPKNTN
jgi:transcriptional regulator with XRE-family HTH domain